MKKKKTYKHVVTFKGHTETCYHRDYTITNSKEAVKYIYLDKCGAFPHSIVTTIAPHRKNKHLTAALILTFLTGFCTIATAYFDIPEATACFSISTMIVLGQLDSAIGTKTGTNFVVFLFLLITVLTLISFP